MHLVKLDIARLQVETAITLYFNEGDPVSIHTLAAAGSDILEALVNQMGGMSALESFLEKYIHEEYQEEVRLELRIPQNFFKHADRDPDAVIDFHPAQTRFILLNAGWTLTQLLGRRPALVRLFETYAAFTWAEKFLQYEPDLEIPSEFLLQVKGSTKSDFYTQMLPFAKAVAEINNGES